MAATILALCALVLLPALYLRDASREKRFRASFFNDSVVLMDSYRITQAGNAWAVLVGHYRGHQIRLEPVMDDMAWRKLPSLWLKATVLTPNPARGMMSFMVRPQGGEFYSPGADMHQRAPVPAAWPQNAMLSTDDVASLPDAATLTPFMTTFDDPRTKELVITPKGVRLVYQAAQGERGAYLVLRQARFDGVRADLELVRVLLDRAIAIAAALDAGQDAILVTEAA